MTFDKAFDLLFGHEGGFQIDPRDTGNWTSGKIGIGELKGTKFGVSAASYPKLNIRNLTLGEAKAIYYLDFWSQLRIDEIPEGARFDVFDTAVNSGVGTAKRLLQKAVGVTADGKLGPVTMAAVKAMDPRTLDKRFNGQRLMYLVECKTWPTYGRTWVRRVAHNLLHD
jgi:lysozyme family protein